MNKNRPANESEAAIRTAMNILAYSDNTAKRLRKKLKEKGYSENAVEDALDYVVCHGFLDESRMLDSAVISILRTKHCGLRMLTAELAEKGFPKELIAEYDYSDIDFRSHCRQLFERRNCVDDEKTYAFLLRHGHSVSDIRAVFDEYRSEESDD